jgi:ABC-2 type transport system permease protein
MFERIKSILTKEFKQIFRDPRMKTVIFISPIIQIILFGYAANKDINYVPTAIYDKDNTVESRELLRRFTYSKYFVPEHYLFTDEEQNHVLDKGLASVVIHIDRGFGRHINADKDAEVQLVFDGTDSNTAQVVDGLCRYDCRKIPAGFNESPRRIKRHYQPHIERRFKRQGVV